MSKNRLYKKTLMYSLVTAIFLCICYLLFGRAIIKSKLDSFEKTIQEIPKNFTRGPIFIGSIHHNIFPDSFTLSDVQLQAKEVCPVLYTSEHFPNDLFFRPNSYKRTENRHKVFPYDLAIQFFGYFQTSNVRIKKITLYADFIDTYEPNKQANTSELNEQILYLEKIFLEHIKILRDKASCRYEQNAKEFILSTLTLIPVDKELLTASVTSDLILNNHAAEDILKTHNGNNLPKQTAKVWQIL